MKFLDFFLFCETFLDPDSESGSGSTALINPDPNPKHYTVLYMKVLTSTFIMFLMRPTWALWKISKGKNVPGTVRSRGMGGRKENCDNVFLISQYPRTAGADIFNTTS
jgi:hypothetical protein